MTNNMIKWLELDAYINDNIKYMTNEEYQENIKELYRLYELVMEELYPPYIKLKIKSKLEF